MIPTHTLAVTAVLGLAAITSAGLALGSGASWPASLLTAIGVTLTVAGLLRHTGGGQG